jgi:hypothetical protein
MAPSPWHCGIPLLGGTVVFLTVAFASDAHADAALGFIARASLTFSAALLSGSTSTDFTRVELTLAAADRERLRTLLAGVRAIVLDERAAEAATA